MARQSEEAPRGHDQVTQWWSEAKDAVYKGQRARAQRFLRWILSACPDDEDAWLLMAKMASTQKERFAYLRQAYEMDPSSVRVLAEMRRVRAQQLQVSVGELRSSPAPVRFLPNDRRVGDAQPAQHKQETVAPLSDELWRSWLRSV